MLRLSTLVIVLTSCCFTACARHEGPSLSDTLVWMDNTYNPHSDRGLAHGHGKTGWYSPSDPNEGNGESLAYGSNETFTYDGCHLTLHVQENAAATALKDAYSEDLYRFNLGDVDPQSIKINTYAHSGGSPCDNYVPDVQVELNCDHAEITFVARSESPLIEETSRTIFPKLQGDQHELHYKSKTSEAYFEVDDLDYAKRFAKALRYAVELCGGKPSTF